MSAGELEKFSKQRFLLLFTSKYMSRGWIMHVDKNFGDKSVLEENVRHCDSTKRENAALRGWMAH